MSIADPKENPADDHRWDTIIVRRLWASTYGETAFVYKADVETMIVLAAYLLA